MDEEHPTTARPKRPDVIDFPAFRAHSWPEGETQLTWDEAAAQLGITRRALRRALDEARATAGPRPLEVEGTAGGRGFRAVRRSASRGVPWRFHILPSEGPINTRISDLRKTLSVEKPHNVIRRPLAWLGRWWPRRKAG